jgi:hypothetical protein
MTSFADYSKVYFRRKRQRACDRAWPPRADYGAALQRLRTKAIQGAESGIAKLLAQLDDGTNRAAVVLRTDFLQRPEISTSTAQSSKKQWQG